MKIERFNEYNAGPKCPVCSSRMYITDRGWHQVTYHCSSDEARFWDFPRGSKDQMISKKHWDESRVEICKNIDEGMSKKSVTKSIFGKIIELNSSNIRKEYSNVIIDQVWKRLASEGITNADSLIGTRETINDKDFNKFWSAVKDVDIQNVVNFFKAEKQKALDSFSKYKGDFDPTTGTFTSNDTSFFDKKIKDLETLLQQKQQAQQVYSQIVDELISIKKENNWL